jgi:hypothetical protein
MPPERSPHPTFLVIGAMKAGTTSLYHYLRDHPQVFMPKIKELDFFAVEEAWSRGPEWYRRQFAGASPEALAIGEASTAYTKFPHYPFVPERIARAVPEAKLIYVVRDPIQRIYSHYRHRVAVGAERAPIERAVLEEPIYVDYSRYALQLEQYLPHFPREQLLVVTSEALRKDRHATVRSVYGFLGVDAGFVPPSLGREFYRSENRPVYPSAMWAVRRAVRRRIPAAKRAKELVDSLGRSVRRVDQVGGSEGAGSGADEGIPAEARAAIRDLLRDDVRRLRSFVGPGFDGWDIG